MEQRRRVLIVAGFVLLATAALGVQAAVIDRGPGVDRAESAEIYPGNTLVGVHSWEDDGNVLELNQEGEVVWSYGSRSGHVESARFFGIYPLQAGEAAPNVEPENDGDVVLFVFGEIVPAEDCPDEYLEYEASFKHGADPQDHCVENRVVLMDRGPDRDEHEIVWEYSWYEEMIHWHEVHDATVTDDGQVAIVDMSRDRLMTVNEAGEITWEFHAEEHVDEGTPFFEEHVENGEHVDDPGAYARSGPLDDWTHWNDIDQLENGNFHVSLRNYDMLIEVDPETDEIVDTIGEPGNTSFMDKQHNPQHLEEHGTVVIADSGNDRIIEADRETEEILWSYNGPQGDPLQWPRDADRLPNGNTLITDSRNNRVIELNDENEIVWQYHDPDGDVMPLPYAAVRLPEGENAGGPSAYELDESIERDHGFLGDVREAETMAHWVLPTWMHLPQQLNLLGIVVGGVWLLGEGAFLGVRRTGILGRARERL